MFKKLIVIFTSLWLVGSLLVACDKTEQQQVDIYDRSLFDQQSIKQGRELFLKNCMVCHGFNAEGAADWQKRDAEGRYPAPPLNGTGHAWHHPKASLMDTIRNGTIRLGGTMPPWKEKLNDQEIEAIIMWFQTKWPDQLYEAWVRRDKENSD